MESMRDINRVMEREMLFNLTYGCYSLFVEIPRDADNSTNFEFEKMPFPPIPFYTSSEGTWDMSEKEVSKDVKHSITLNFGTMNDCSDNIVMGNGEFNFVRKE